jgi:hypothetical protein
MKPSFLLLAVASCLQAISQDFALENARTKGSTRLYVGVVNALLIKGDANKIVQVRAGDAAVQRNNDTLFINPGMPGDLTLFIETESGTNEYAFIANYLPPPQLVIDTTRLDIESILNGSAFSIAQTDPDRIYANCILHTLDLAIGNTTVNIHAPNARNVIINRKPYHKVYLNKFILIDKNNGRKRTVRCHKELKL